MQANRQRNAGRMRIPELESKAYVKRNSNLLMGSDIGICRHVPPNHLVFGTSLAELPLLNIILLRRHST